MTHATPAVDVTMTVKELVDREPRVRDGFARFGMDTCCGATVPIADAAARHGIELDALVAALAGTLAA
jgi:iron-sulfur cluster repair protein YtfE (RIC family)